MISPEHVVIPANSASKRGSNLTSCCGSCSSASIPENTRDERSRSLDIKIEKASSGPRQQSPCPIPEGDVWANRQPLWSLVTHTHLAVITRGESHCLGGQTGLSRNRSHPGAAAVRCDGTTTVHIRRAAEGTEKGWEPLITLLMPLGKLPDTPSIKTAHPGKMANDKQPTVRPHDSKMIPDAGGAMAVQTGAGLSATRWGTGWKWQRIPHQRACTHTHTHTLSLLLSWLPRQPNMSHQISRWISRVERGFCLLKAFPFFPLNSLLWCWWYPTNSFTLRNPKITTLSLFHLRKQSTLLFFFSYGVRLGKPGLSNDAAIGRFEMITGPIRVAT